MDSTPSREKGDNTVRVAPSLYCHVRVSRHRRVFWIVRLPCSWRALGAESPSDVPVERERRPAD